MAEIQLTVKKNMFNDIYFPYLEDYSRRFNIYFGGAGSGKSRFVVQKMVYKYLKYAGRKCLVIRKIGKDIRDSIYAEFESVMSSFKMYEHVKFKDTLLHIELPNGSSFIFKGLDDNERIKSIADIDDIIIEEATEISLEDFLQLNLRLRSRKPNNQIYMMYNPTSKANWVYEYWHVRKLNPDTEFLLHTTYFHNRFLPQDYIDSIEVYKETNPTYYKIFSLGEFATLDKLIFTNWKIEEFNHKDILNQNKEAIAVFAVDFGYTNDPTAFLAAVADKNSRRIHIYDEFQEKGLLNNEIAKKIISMGYGKEVIIADSAEPKSIEELRQNGLERVKGVRKGKDSVLNGIQYLQQFEIIVHPRCKFISEELANYTWQKDRNGFYVNKPIDTYNHGIDCARYSMAQVKKNLLGIVSIRG